MSIKANDTYFYCQAEGLLLIMGRKIYGNVFKENPLCPVTTYFFLEGGTWGT